MARAVYSILVVGDPAATAGDHDFGSPGLGFIWVIRDIVLRAPADQAFACQSAWVLDGADAVIFGVSNPLVRGNECYHWSGRQVMNPADTLIFRCFNNGWSVRISGYKLSTP